MPFFVDMLEVFTKSPNRYQRRKGSKCLVDEEELDDDSEQEDEHGEETDDSPASESADGSRFTRIAVVRSCSEAQLYILYH